MNPVGIPSVPNWSQLLVQTHHSLNHIAPCRRRRPPPPSSIILVDIYLLLLRYLSSVWTRIVSQSLKRSFTLLIFILLVFVRSFYNNQQNACLQRGPCLPPPCREICFHQIRQEQSSSCVSLDGATHCHFHVAKHIPHAGRRRIDSTRSLGPPPRCNEACEDRGASMFPYRSAWIIHTTYTYGRAPPVPYPHTYVCVCMKKSYRMYGITMCATPPNSIGQ